MKTDNEIFKIIFNRSLLRYFNERFISFEGKTFLVEIDEGDIFLVSFSGIQLINDFPEEISLNLSSNQINNFLNSWFSENRLLKIIPNFGSGRRFWLTEKVSSSDDGYLVRDSRCSSIVFNLESKRKATYYNSYDGGNLIHLREVYKFDIPDKEGMEQFIEYGK